MEVVKVKKVKDNSVNVKINVDNTGLDATFKLIAAMTKKTDELLSNLSEIETKVHNLNAYFGIEKGENGV